jgi:hypothetical protein
MWLRDEVLAFSMFWNAAVVELWNARRRGDTPAGPARHANRYANRHAQSDLGADSRAYQNTQTNPYGKGEHKPIHAHPATHAHPAANGHSFAHANSRSRGKFNGSP